MGVGRSHENKYGGFLGRAVRRVFPHRTGDASHVTNMDTLAGDVAI